MNRVDGNWLLDTLTRLRQDMDELKNAQVVGPHSLFGYINRTTNQYDATFHITAGQTQTYSLVFTHDHSLHGAMEILDLFYSLNNPDVATFFVPPWAQGPIVYRTIQKLPPTNTQTEWRIAFTNSSGSTAYDVYLKFVGTGSDSGSFSFTRLT